MSRNSRAYDRPIPGTSRQTQEPKGVKGLRKGLTWSPAVSRAGAVETLSRQAHEMSLIIGRYERLLDTLYTKLPPAQVQVLRETVDEIIIPTEEDRPARGAYSPWLVQKVLPRIQCRYPNNVEAIMAKFQLIPARYQQDMLEPGRLNTWLRSAHAACITGGLGHEHDAAVLVDPPAEAEPPPPEPQLPPQPPPEQERAPAVAPPIATAHNNLRQDNNITIPRVRPSPENDRELLERQQRRVAPFIKETIGKFGLEDAEHKKLMETARQKKLALKSDPNPQRTLKTANVVGDILTTTRGSALNVHTKDTKLELGEKLALKKLTELSRERPRTQFKEKSSGNNINVLVDESRARQPVFTPEWFRIDVERDFNICWLDSYPIIGHDDMLIGDRSLVHKLRLDAAFVKRDAKLMTSLKHKAIRHMAEFDVSHLTPEQYVSLIQGSVLIAYHGLSQDYAYARMMKSSRFQKTTRYLNSALD